MNSDIRSQVKRQPLQIEVPEYIDDQGLTYEESSLDDGNGGNGKMP